MISFLANLYSQFPFAIAAALLLTGYLAGSVSSAILVCRAMGLPDPRNEGSKNPGATNMMRLHGRKPAAITLAGDVLKGILPVLLAKAFGADAGVVMLCGFAAFVGHLIPVFYGFLGGKGVATGLGAVIAFDWRLALVLGLIWLLVFALSRISSLSALFSFGILPLLALFTGYGGIVVTTCLAMTVLIFYRHRSNIKNLMAGTEGSGKA